MLQPHRRHASPGRDAATQPKSGYSSIRGSTNLPLCSGTNRPRPPVRPKIVPQARSDIVPRPKTYPLSRQQSQLCPRHWPHQLTLTGGLVIPRDRAGLHHRPTVRTPSRMFAPAPVRPVVLLCRPSGNVPEDQLSKTVVAWYRAYQGHSAQREYRGAEA